MLTVKAETGKTMTTKHSFDTGLIIIVLILVGFGIIMVYSSTFILSSEKYGGDPYYFLKRQALSAAVGMAAMAITMIIDYRRWRPLSLPLMVVSACLLAALFIPQLSAGSDVRRWLKVPLLNQFQPSEVAKFALILYTADFLARKGEELKRIPKGIAPYLIASGGLIFLIVKQPNFGTAAIIVTILLLLWFMGGASTTGLLIAGATAGGAVTALALATPHSLERIKTFLNPLSDPEGSGYQISQSIRAIGAGGLWGAGLGEGKEKFFYLPALHTDFIFANVGEELGFVGCFALIALYAAVSFKGLKVALTTEDLFGSLLAAGITSLIGWQAAINIGVTVGLVPTTGVTLPFVSSGGSSLVSFLGGIGLLLSISRHGSEKREILKKRRGYSALRP
jgi:cell division protein FtsW